MIWTLVCYPSAPGPNFRSTDDELYDIVYMSFWDWLKYRFGPRSYVKRVRQAQREGKTYEPLLYEDMMVQDEKGVVRDCINQELPRWKMNYEMKENWK